MPVYLDHAATTPMLPDALAAYVEALGVVGNPASIHSQGQQARRMLEEARENIAASVGADSVEVVLTSGGTEAVNLGVKGLFWKRQEGHPRPRILVPGGEHHATIDAVDWLASHDGADIEWLPIDENGRLHPATLREALERESDSIALVTFLWANNEVGTIQPVAELTAVASEFGVPSHVDAVSAFGYVLLDFHASGAAALSISAHKVGGPVGVGALLLARSAEVVPLFHGGSQQRGRSGTQDVAGAVSFGVAATRAAAEVAEHAASLSVLRDRLVDGVRAAVPEAVLRGDPDAEGRLPGNAHFTFPGCEGDSLLFLLDVAGLSVSTGSACQAGVPEASHVLTAMGLSEADARGALRMTLGHGTTSGDVDAVIAALPSAFAQARKAGLSDRVVPLGHAR
ncbi:cysteine desulfurase family protein [Agreia sp. COWG]|uniref:cysteine desulfurase family protein n=1 Tax=Agreia sp. COWG TaxID=2773266 RepID=UPI00192926EB|nr:cysteine desulfurase family protein [Agreia sp. COWG]CAD5995749.1 IscS-like cysteine desulfurase [Agreia sp. COWG]